MENVVITGRGLVTPLGNGLPENEKALYSGRSGTVMMPEWRELGLDSQVAGLSDEDPECPLIDKKRKRFASINSRMAICAAYEAANEAGLDSDAFRKSRTAIILGCAGSNYQEIYDGAELYMNTRKVRRVSPFIVPRVMPSSAVSNLSLILGITGESYDVSSACASGAHAIMLATRLIRSGQYDIVVTGGAEELNWVHALGFNAMRALSRKYNDNPSIASRPFDRDRDGFVIAEGAGIIVLESEKHAKERGAKTFGSISGVAANSNATDMVVPHADSSAEVMEQAIKEAGLKTSDIDYINTHGTATPTGDPVEMTAIRKLFGEDSKVAINSTKSMTGHMIGATGSVEVIYCSLMLEKQFICPSINCDNPEDDFLWADLVRETRDNVDLKHCLSNSFGFGGSNASLIISK